MNTIKYLRYIVKETVTTSKHYVFLTIPIERNSIGDDPNALNA